MRTDSSKCLSLLFPSISLFQLSHSHIRTFNVLMLVSLHRIVMPTQITTINNWCVVHPVSSSKSWLVSLHSEDSILLFLRHFQLSNVVVFVPTFILVFQRLHRQIVLVLVFFSFICKDLKLPCWLITILKATLKLYLMFESFAELSKPYQGFAHVTTRKQPLEVREILWSDNCILDLSKVLYQSFAIIHYIRHEKQCGIITFHDIYQNNKIFYKY